MDQDNHKTFVDGDLPNLVLTRLNDQRRNGVDCDFTIEVCECAFHCHKCLIRACSPVVDEACRADNLLNTFMLPGATKEILQRFLEYIYTARLEVDSETATELFRIGDLLQIDHIKHSCLQYIEQSISLVNVSAYFESAISHGFSEIKQICCEFCARNFEYISTRERHLNIPPEEFIQIVTNAELCIKEEEALLNAIIQWINHDPAVRLPFAHQLSANIRYQLINVERLISTLLNGDLQFAHDHIKAALVELEHLAGELAKERWERINSSCSTTENEDNRNSVNNFKESFEQENEENLSYWREVNQHRSIVAVLGGRANDKRTLKTIVCISFEPETMLDESELVDTSEETRDQSTMPRVQLAEQFKLRSMPTARRAFGAALLWNQLFVFGGKPTYSMPLVHVYDFTADEWMCGPNMRQGRGWFGSTSVDSSIYVLGGVDVDG